MPVDVSHLSPERFPLLCAITLEQDTLNHCLGIISAGFKAGVIRTIDWNSANSMLTRTIKGSPNWDFEYQHYVGKLEREIRGLESGVTGLRIRLAAWRTQPY